MVKDKVLLSANKYNFAECVQLAQEFNLGIEVMTFAFPDVLDGNWEELLAEYKALLSNIDLISVHGPFMDMAAGSPDERINELCRQRYKHGIHIAAELNSRILVVHANFIGSLHNTIYREGWHKRNVSFWSEMADYAQKYDVQIALENMWEYDPTILSDLLSDVDHPYLKTCLDVGHAHLFSDYNYTLQNWLEKLEPWLIHSHMNNNDGKVDVHHGFRYESGVLNYHEILKMFKNLKNQPTIVLEMDKVEDMRDSLPYLLGDREITS